jgi:hypothetical protein
MAQFRFARDTIANSLTAAKDVVNSRAELLTHIRRNIVYLHDLIDVDLHIVPPPSGARLVVSPTSLYIVRTPDYGLIGFLDGPLTSEERWSYYV